MRRWASYVLVLAACLAAPGVPPATASPLRSVDGLAAAFGSVEPLGRGEREWHAGTEHRLLLEPLTATVSALDGDNPVGATVDRLMGRRSARAPTGVVPGRAKPLDRGDPRPLPGALSAVPEQPQNSVLKN